jgi:hypothetical protein
VAERYDSEGKYKRPRKLGLYIERRLDTIVKGGISPRGTKIFTHQQSSRYPRLKNGSEMIRPNDSVHDVTWLSAATNNTGRVGFRGQKHEVGDATSQSRGNIGLERILPSRSSGT